MKLVLIDYSSVAHPLWHVHGGSPDPNATSTAIIEKVRALASGQPHVALCIDTGKSFRNDISADYKANREARPAALYHQMDVALDVLRGDGFPVWGSAGYEADDVVATAVFHCEMRNMRAGEESIDVLIVSADKDLAQLISERVTCFSPMTGKTRGLADMQADFGIAPSQVVDYLSLVGDASDNVKGADGIGPKKATVLLNTFGNLDDLYASMDKGEASLLKATEKSLVEFRPRLAEVRQLLTLRTDAPIAFEEIFAERVPADVATFGGDDDIAFALPTLEEPTMSKHDEDYQKPGFQQDIIEAQPALLPATVSATVTSPTAGDGMRPSFPNGADSGASLAVRTPDVIEPAPVGWERQLEPRTMNQAVQLSQMMHKARLFSAYGSPEGVLSTVLAGREMGFQSMASLRAFHIIDNKPTLSSGAIHALVLKSGKAEYFRCTERTAERATFATKRKGEPEMALTFTMDEAKQAWSKEASKFAQSGYGRNPADMLVARALTKLARLVYPDVLNGLYAAEEFDQ